MEVKVQYVPRVYKDSKRKQAKDRRQNNRLFMRSYRGGLPSRIINEYNKLHREKTNGKAV